MFVQDGVGVFLLDLRYHRSFAPGPAPANASLVGSVQLSDFVTAMDAWREDERIKSILVLSNMPILYPSTPLADLVETVERASRGRGLLSVVDNWV